MRLIDAEALLERMRKDPLFPLVECYGISGVIDAEPTIEERKTGRWIRDEFGSKCGACGLYAYRDKFDRPWESPYCPNCGAKMDAERREE